MFTCRGLRWSDDDRRGRGIKSLEQLQDTESFLCSRHGKGTGTGVCPMWYFQIDYGDVHRLATNKGLGFFAARGLHCADTQRSKQVGKLVNGGPFTPPPIGQQKVQAVRACSLDQWFPVVAMRIHIKSSGRPTAT